MFSQKSFVLLKEFGAGHFFYSYFISRFYFGCRDQGGLPRLGLLQLFEESFCSRVEHGFSLQNSWHLT